MTCVNLTVDLKILMLYLTQSSRPQTFRMIAKYLLCVDPDT